MPVNGRIVILAGGLGGAGDRAADELARRLAGWGWWVDRPDGLRTLPRWLGVLLRRVHRRVPGIGLAAGRVAAAGPPGAGGVVTDRVSARVGALLLDPPHAVVATSPLLAALLGRWRERTEPSTPLISYFDLVAGPAWWHAGIDVVLCPGPAATALARRRARTEPGPRLVETAPVRSPGPAATAEPGRVAAVRAELGVPPGRLLVVIASQRAPRGWGARTAADVARWGAWPVLGAAPSRRRRHRRLRFGSSSGGARVEESTLAGVLAAADVIVSATAPPGPEHLAAVDPAVIHYRVRPGPDRTAAAALEAAGERPWARSPDDLGMLLDALARGESLTGPGRSTAPDPATVVHQLAATRGQTRAVPTARDSSPPTWAPAPR